MREATAERMADDEGLYLAAADPQRPLAPPRREEPVPHLNFAPLENAMEQLRARVKDLDAARDAAKKPDGSLSSAKARALNAVLLTLERSMASDEGLPGRTWYRHLVYAPGFYTGYGVKTLPLVREAIEARRWNEVEEAVARTAAMLNRLAGEIGRAGRRRALN